MKIKEYIPTAEESLVIAALDKFEKSNPTFEVQAFSYVIGSHEVSIQVKNPRDGKVFSSVERY